MAHKIVMTELVPDMKKGLIIRWLKEEGDSVDVGELICEVEADKSATDYESEFAGTLLKIVAREGEEVPLGAVIAIIGEKDENVEGLV